MFYLRSKSNNFVKKETDLRIDSEDKKDAPKKLELIKPNSKAETQKKFLPSLKNCKAKTSIKKVGRSRTQKGHKNY